MFHSQIESQLVMIELAFFQPFRVIYKFLLAYLHGSLRQCQKQKSNNWISSTVRWKLKSLSKNCFQ